MTSLSTTPAAVHSPKRLGQARAAVAVLFLTNGALFANLLPHYPSIKAELELSNTALGISIAAFPLGAIIAGLASGSLIRRFRSARVATAGTILIGLAILIAGLPRPGSPSPLPCSLPGPWTPLWTLHRTPTDCASRSSTSGPSSIPSTQCGASEPCSAA